LEALRIPSKGCRLLSPPPPTGDSTTSFLLLVLAACGGDVPCLDSDSFGSSDGGTVMSSPDFGDDIFDDLDDLDDDDSGVDAPDFDFGGTDSDTYVPDGECEYLVETWDGDIMMTNYPFIDACSRSPQGLSEPGYQEVLRVRYGASNENCPPMYFGGLTLYIGATDIHETYWYEDVEGIDAVNNMTGEQIGFGRFSVCHLNGGGCPQSTGHFSTTPDEEYGRWFDGVTALGGETVSISFWVDLSGIGEGDTFKLTFGPDQMSISDDGSQWFTWMFDSVGASDPMEF